MKKRFIRGQLILERGMSEDKMVVYERERDNILSEILRWATYRDVSLEFGLTTGDNYVCNYRIVAPNASSCRFVLSELKARLKAVSGKKPELGFETSGYCW